ncbi:TPA: hypothetical protein N0F65_011896 [Lagenidium giganteum]|uniref:Chromatin target of PRMT1 protein C-terminal domain-containing protein n=1 Tax=Lagenidium giganteum TaxID=4803 RepID=A0AAV2YME1_9STRA|nr:TPA: hypothetical protein N0F65_011896 [Lagenidium giganteum]
MPGKPQPRVAVKKSGRVQQENSKHNQNKQLVGASSVSLSERFSHLQDQPYGNGVVQKKQQKVQQAAQANKAQRQQVTNKRRAGLQQAPVTKPKQQHEAAKKNNNKAQNKNKPAQKKTGGKGGAKGGQRGEKKENKPVKSEDLDVEMDAYWHEAGKGPDPKAAQLDRQLDDYWASKPQNDEAADKQPEAAATDSS